MEAYNQIAATAATYPAISKVILFGSRARGTASRVSDIDLCVFCEDDRDFNHFYMDMEEIDIIYHIDVVQYHTISSDFLLAEIARDGVVLYERGAN